MRYSINSNSPQAKITIHSNNVKTDDDILENVLSKLKSQTGEENKIIQYQLETRKSKDSVDIILELVIDNQTEFREIYHVSDVIFEITQICVNYDDMIAEFIPNKTWNSCKNLSDLIRKETKIIRSIKKISIGFQAIFSKNYDVSVYEITDKASKKIMGKNTLKLEDDLKKLQKQVKTLRQKITTYKLYRRTSQSSKRRKLKKKTRKSTSTRNKNLLKDTERLKNLNHRKNILEEILRIIPRHAVTRVNS